MKIQKKHKKEAIQHLSDVVKGVQHVISLINDEKEINNEDWQKAAAPLHEYMLLLNKNNSHGNK